MRPLEIVEGLTAHERRGGGSDAERRAALWLAARLREGGREALLETFWSRPNWAAAHAWHAALALAGSLLAVRHPRIGGALLLLALVSTALDGLAGVSLGRRLTPERASQNVIALPPERERDKSVWLILSANYDAGRTGIVHRPILRGPCARACRAVHGLTPGWLGWLTLAIGWLLAVALARAEGAAGAPVAVAQLLPTVGVVIAFAALLELAASPPGPAANDNASGVAAALTLARALDAAPPAHAAVHVVLTGASDGDGTGLRHYLRARRRSLRPQDAVVIGLAACGAGRAVWWHSDGPLYPMRHLDTLRRMCAQLAAEGVEPELEPHRGRGTSPALWARQRGIPSIALGRLGTDGLTERSHREQDIPAALDPGPLDLSIALVSALIDRIDGHLASLSWRSSGRRSARRHQDCSHAIANFEFERSVSRAARRNRP
jgi:hypothetical protein